MVTASSVVQDIVAEADNENEELCEFDIPTDFYAYNVKTDAGQVWWAPEPELLEA